MLADSAARGKAPSFELVQRFLADRRKGLAGWAIGLTAYTDTHRTRSGYSTR